MLLQRTTIILLISIFIFKSEIKSQEHLGLINSNYAGITGVSLQPASIADSRYRFDMNLFGGSFYAGNNYISLRQTGLWYIVNKDDEPLDFKEEFLIENPGDRNKRVAASVSLNLPSFMITLSENDAIGFSWRLRNVFNLHEIDPDLAKLAWEELKYEPLWLTDLDNDKVNLQFMSWAEYGITYARVLQNDGPTMIKAGATLKLLQGIGAAYLYADNLNYMFTNDDTLSIYDSRVSYGHSEGMEFDFVDPDKYSYDFVSNPSFGLDLGVVYEWRPDHMDSDNDNNNNNLTSKPDFDRHLNKYKLKVGFSILDLGRMKFDKSPRSQSFNADVENWYLDPLNFNNLNSFNDTIYNRFGHLDDDDQFNMTLPTSYSLQVDYNIEKDFYLNFTAFYSPRLISNKNRVHEVNNFSLTPRWDAKWLGAALPFSIDEFGQFNLGMALRLGPVFIGINDIGAILWKEDIMSLHAHAAVKVPIMFNKPKPPKVKPPPPPPPPPPIVLEEPEPEPDPEPEPMSPEDVYVYVLENYGEQALAGLLYSVQIGAYISEPRDQLLNQYRRYGNLIVKYENNWHRALINNIDLFRQAEDLKNRIRSETDSKDAFVVFYYNGVRINIYEVLDLYEPGE